MKEVWKDIPLYKGIYEVSNLGKVRSKVTGKLATTFKSKKGYIVANIYLNGRCKHERVHRLVAITFIPNPNNYPQVNHKDEVKTNNCVTNLEWCDCEYNNYYGTHTERSSMHTPKEVEVDGVKFKSISKCARYLGLHHSTLNNYLIGKTKVPSWLQNRNLQLC